MDSRAVGIRIKEARKAQNMTQEELADRVGLSTTHVSVIERGVKSPKLETFVAIANELNVSADSLLIDVVDRSVQSCASELANSILKLPMKEQRRVMNVIRAFIEG
ncbi:MAG: helix-turn-helix transcriptional regulator [Lachnospiraceae bacterium]|nr:helix-turn-helix transcriptional regulator [Lachnospiraceae bacterium]MDD3796251.1 helix-turn-helix transcriptional regulator [Lachnospiraceae bacterium]